MRGVWTRGTLALENPLFYTRILYDVQAWDTSENMLWILASDMISHGATYWIYIDSFFARPSHPHKNHHCRQQFFYKSRYKGFELLPYYSSMFEVALL